jgi:hypothetical protein
VLARDGADCTRGISPDGDDRDVEKIHFKIKYIKGENHSK